MDPNHGEESSELFRAQAHIYKHTFAFANSMCLKCAIQLGIPDIIHNHKQPITLPDLVTALQLPPTKTSYVHRLMRLLVHSGFFATKIIREEEEEGYVLTLSSKLLLKDQPTSLSTFVQAIVDPLLLSPWQVLGDWFGGNELTAFETAHGASLWDCAGQNPRLNKLLNDTMESDSGSMRVALRNCKEIFGGLGSLVDVGGGTGTVSRIVLEAFPHIKCIVLDLPHVVADLPESKNLKFVAGDMFQSIPPADAILIKRVLHNWSDEDCVKILKRCREAIPSKDDGGKVIIIDTVINGERDEHDLTELKLVFDIFMMVLVNGRQRNEKEWEKILFEAGFSNYKITPIFDLRSLIEVYLREI